MKWFNLTRINEWLEFTSQVILIIGIPFSIYQYIKTSAKEKQDRDYEVYNSLDQEFKDWELLCLANPELDIFDVPDSVPVALTKEQLKQETILFTVLFSTFERAYLLYANEDDDIRKAQWSGWRDYIMSYCQRENFRRAWRVSGTTFDTGFQDFMSVCIKQSTKAP